MKNFLQPYKNQNLFDDFFDHSFAHLLPSNFKALDVDVKENKDSYEIIANVPGVKKENIELSLNGNMLTISIKEEGENKISEDKYLQKEISKSFFSRSFILPSMINEDQVVSKLCDGVLSIFREVSRQ